MEGLLEWTVQGGVLMRLVLAIGLGGLVGLEREWKGRPAGLRTHVLVCLGATILLIAARGASVAFQPASGSSIVLDPNRISAGIVTGIGFLGAGAVLRTGDLIRGLTTGATIWFVAALGIVIGNGFFPLAIVSTLAMLLFLELLDIAGRHIHGVVYRALTVRASATGMEALEAWLDAWLAKERVRVMDKYRSIDITAETVELTYQLRARSNQPLHAFVGTIAHREGVTGVELRQT